MTATDNECGAIDMTNVYNATDDVHFLARKTYERKARESGGREKWDALPLSEQKKYVTDAGWTIHMLLGLRGYRTPGGER